MTPTSRPDSYDVVVIGGGAAGLAGALALARSRRSVLVVDAGEPRNAPAGHVHNYLGREGTPPAELYAVGRAEVEQYGAVVRTGRVVAATPWTRGTGFDLALEDGSTVAADRVLVATGARDRLPDLPGLAARWGRDVVHCPYCHGWEVRDQAIGVIATGPGGAHQALLFAQLSDDVVVFLDGASPLAEADLERLAARGVRVVEEPLAEVVVEDDRIAGVRLAGGEVVARQVLAVSTYVDASSPVLDALGLEAEPVEMMGAVVGTAVGVDPTGRTAVPGVFAAGNVTTPTAQVIASASAGLMAGAMINHDLIEQRTAAALADHRAQQEAS